MMTNEALIYTGGLFLKDWNTTSVAQKSNEHIISIGWSVQQGRIEDQLKIVELIGKELILRRSEHGIYH